jgi:hypothetical protein
MKEKEGRKEGRKGERDRKRERENKERTLEIRNTLSILYNRGLAQSIRKGLRTHYSLT